MDDILQLKIESYISNSMSKKDMELFEIEITNNTVLEKEVNLAKELNHFLKDEYLDLEYSNSKEVDKINSFLQSEEATKIEKTLLKVKDEYHSVVIKPKRFNYFAAASVVILFSVLSYFMININSTENLFLEHYNLNDLPSLTKRDDVNNNLTNGVNAFKVKKYKESLLFFNKIEEKTLIETPTLYLYIGTANLELNNNKKAIKSFDDLIHSNAIDASKGYWFKALLYLKMDERTKAKEVLLIIALDKSNYKYKEAKKILNNLE